MLQQALAVMVHDLDVIDYGDDLWATADRMLADYTKEVET